MKSNYIFPGFLVATFLLLIAVGMPAGAVQSLTFTVNSTADSVDANPGDGVCMDANGKCTLRAAIMEANADTGIDTIVFDSSTDGTPIVLTLHGANEDNDATGDLDILVNLTITGNGTDKTIIDGDAADRVFDVNPLASAALSVEIDDLTVQNGKTGYEGGGIHVQYTTLVLDSDLIQNNEAVNISGQAFGGGIEANGANVTLDNTDVQNNTVTTSPNESGGGGGIDFGSGLGPNVLQILDGSVIADNVVQAQPSDGGGIEFVTGTLTINNSSVRGNQANGAADNGAIGGGMFVLLASYTISNSEVSGNEAHTGSNGAYGGGIETDQTSSDSTIINSTISGNSAIADTDPGEAFGGGVNLGSTPAGVTEALDNVTISGNDVSVPSSNGGGGGLDIGQNHQGTDLLQNTLIAGNQSSSTYGPDCYGGTVVSGGYNLIGDGTSCAFMNAGGDHVGTGSDPVDPKLGALADNGGPTQTMALLAGSPAVDAGNPAGCTNAAGNPLTTDQRGSPRPTDGNADGTAICDIGAYERAADHPPSASDSSVTTTENQSVSGTLKASDPDGDALTYAIATQPAHGSVMINDASKGTFTYTPASNYSGKDSFTFTANDGFVDSNAATESVTVNASGGGGSGGNGGNSGGGGGGAYGPFALLGLLLLAVVPWWLKKRSRPDRPRAFIRTITFLAIALTGFNTFANPADLDTGFGAGGVVETDTGFKFNQSNAVLVQPDGKIILAGVQDSSSNSYTELTRYLPDGSTDTSFGNNGLVLYSEQSGSYLDNEIQSAAIMPDGKILVSGFLRDSTTDNSKFLLWRFNTDGTVDGGFGTSGGGAILTTCPNTSDVQAIAFDMAIADDGSIYLAGVCENSSGSDTHNVLLHFKPDGALDTNFGTNGFASVNVTGQGSPSLAYGVAISQDGGIYVLGEDLNPSTQQGEGFVVKYTTAGQPDTAFGTGGIVRYADTTSSENGFLRGIVQPDGKLLALGYVGPAGSVPGYSFLLRLGANGTPDASFGTDGVMLLQSGQNEVAIHSLTLMPDGHIYAGGFLCPPSPAQCQAILGRFTTAGALDSTFGSGGGTAFPGNPYFSEGEAVALQPDGKVLIATRLEQTSNDNYIFAAARFLGTQLTLTPATFSFMSQSGVALNATITSNAITVSGLSSGVSVPVSVTGGEYSINGGAWTSNPGYTQNGDEIAVRHTSSGSYSTQTTTSLAVGGYVVPNNTQIVLGSPATANFTTTTKAASSPPQSGGGGGGGAFGSFTLLGLLLSIVSLRSCRRHVCSDQHPGRAPR